MFILWLAGRAGVLFSSDIGMLPAAVIDVLFYVVFAAVAAREVLAAKNRNLPIVALVLLFGVASALGHLAAAGVTEAGLGARAGIALVVLMITLIGGRIDRKSTRPNSS